MENNIDSFIIELEKTKFEKIIPQDYAIKLRDEFRNDTSLWYNEIIPDTRAKEFLEKTNNDYSKIWHTHCYCCWKNIDKSTPEHCYVSEDKLIWLCKECYNEIFKN